MGDEQMKGASAKADRAVVNGAASVSALRASVPSAASFNVGQYSDGSGPMQRVSYDTTSEYTPESIWIEGGEYSDQWVAFDWRIAEELIVAIRAAAQAIEARNTPPTHGIGK